MQTLSERIENWARWARNRRHRFEHCRSLEHKYRSPQIWHPPGPRPPEVQLFDALEVEKAVTQCPKKYRTIIINHYVKATNPAVTCRIVKIRFTDYDASLNMAISLLADKLS